jgi:hypothetical protein
MKYFVERQIDRGTKNHDKDDVHHQPPSGSKALFIVEKRIERLTRSLNGKLRLVV